ncbi:hypothetical protein BDF22DRAFT_745740 [Syncephalis plumigaleata]|nr:hypothetical protein BDF22DRAFT_745740 [Syncephalis plumigaleata]
MTTGEPSTSMQSPSGNGGGGGRRRTSSLNPQRLLASYQPRINARQSTPVSSVDSSRFCIYTEMDAAELVISEVTSIQSLLRQDRSTLTATSVVEPTTLKDVSGKSGVASGEVRGEGTLWTHFEALRVNLTERQEEFEQLSAAEILSPFLTAVRSINSNIVVRSTALHSLEKFFVYGIIRDTTPGVTEALRGFTASMTKCRDSVSESTADHLILVRMLLAIQAVAISPCGRYMDDVGVCELLEIGLSLCCQMRLEESLRRMAESCMTTFVRVLFASLNNLDNEVDGNVDAITDPDVHVTVHADWQYLRLMINLKWTQLDLLLLLRLLTVEPISIGQPSSPMPSSPVQPTLPYGVASLYELLRVLISLCDPHNLRYTDTIRMTALNILLAAVETGGANLAHFDSLRNLIVDDLLAYTFQLIYTEKTLLLNSVFKVIIAVFDTLRPFVTRQFELLVDLLLRRLALSDAELLVRATRQFSTTEYRLRLLDTLIRVANLEALAPTLWLNYDCQLGRRNMVDALLGYLCTTMVARASQALITTNDALLPDLNELEALKASKRLLHDAAARFNHSPKEGVLFLQEHHIIPPAEQGDREKALAQFFQTTPDLDKKMLGEYLGNQKSQGVLEAFMRQYDFRGKRIDEALRLLLESFRLPGESQQIDRIVETFSRVYFELEPEYLATQDAVYVLAFSIILLNTDLHNPQIKNRMQIEDYMRNLRGVNGGKDFDVDFLTSIYNTIRDHEILMPEEHEGELGFMYTWREMVRNTKDEVRMTICMDGRYDRVLFKEFGRTLWHYSVVVILERANNDVILEQAFEGIRLCAELSSLFDMPDMFDVILPMLSSGSTTTEKTRIEREIPVTQLSVRFGRDYKAQLMTVQFFRTVCRHGNRFRDDGWMMASISIVLDVVMTAFRAACLPESLTIYEDPISSIFSALSNYLMPTYDPESDPVTPEEISAALNTYNALNNTPASALSNTATNASGMSTAAGASSNNNNNNNNNERNRKRSSTRPEYDPLAVFALELAVQMGVKHPTHLLILWNYYIKRLEGILEHPNRNHPFMVQRATFHLFVYVNLFLKINGLKALQWLVHLPDDYFDSVMATIIASSMQSLITARLSSISRAREQQDALASLITQCMREDAAVPFITTMIDQSMEQLKNLSGFGFAIELLTSMGLGSFDETTVEASTTTQSKSKFSSLRIRSSSSSHRQHHHRTTLHSPGQASSTQSPPSSGKGKSPRTERALNVVEQLYQLASTANELSKQSDDLRETRLSVHPTREVRFKALGCIDRLIYSSSITMIHYYVLIDNTDKKSVVLSENDMPTLSDNDLNDVRLRVYMILCKYYLHHLSHIHQSNAVPTRWARVLDATESYMNNDADKQAIETVGEQIKNMLMVMQAMELFGRRHESSIQRQLWTLTWPRIDHWYPNLKNELFTPTPTNTTMSTTNTSTDNVEADTTTVETTVDDNKVHTSTSSSSSSPVVEQEMETTSIVTTSSNSHK